MKHYRKITLIALTLLLLVLAGCGTRESGDRESDDYEDSDWDDSEEDKEADDGQDEDEEVVETLSASETPSPTETTAPTEKPIDSKLLIREMVNNVIVPKYGLANIKQKGVIYNSTYDWESLSKERWLNPKGVVSAYIDDLDLDNENELMVVYITGGKRDDSSSDYVYHNICADIYELKDNKLVLSDTIDFSSINNVSNSRLIVSVVNAKGKKYIVYEKSSSTVFGDGICQDYIALEYTDDKIYNAFSYIQTAGGSSDFEFTGYEYEKGKLFRESKLYSEWYEEPGKYNTVMEGIKYLFSKYGIKINPKAFYDSKDGWSTGWVKNVYDANQISILRKDKNVIPVVDYSVKNYNNGYKNGIFKFKAVGRDYTGLR